MFTILKKEFRHYTPLVLAMLLLCLFIQSGAFLITFFGNAQPVLYFVIAVYITAVYAGTAAAVSFAAEHDDKTFHFLRRLPVSVKDVLVGKSVWLIVSTLAMLAGSLVLTVIWQLANFVCVDFGDAVFWGIFGTGIIEALMWGLFWSPRCRTMIHSLLLTYSCAALESYASAALFADTSTQMQEAYLRAVPLRLAVCAVLAVFAVRSMRRWFDADVNSSRPAASGVSSTGKPPLAPPKEGNYLIPPTEAVCFPPFLSLIFHCIRQSRAVLSIGLLLSLVLGIYWANDVRSETLLENMFLDLNKTFLFLFAGCFYLFYCGSIFAPDQKNGSYRILSRFGVSPRKVWFSRIVPFAAAAAISLTVFLCLYKADSIFSHHGYSMLELSADFRKTSFLLPFIIAFWLIPFSVGSFMSVSLSNQIVSAALTAAGSVLMFAWMYFGILFCGFNPLWFVLPLCVMLIFASYLRTADWLREYSTWSNRFRILIPFFCTGAVILAVVPPVRIYSIPFVPLSEAEALLAKINMPEQLSAEKRHALFEQTAELLNKPFQQSEWVRNNDVSGYSYGDNVFQFMPASDSKNLNPPERLKLNTGKIQDGIKRQPDFETYTLRGYATRYRLAKSAVMPSEEYYRKEFAFAIRMFQFLPWERHRAMRRLNRQLLADISNGYSERQGINMRFAQGDSRYYKSVKAEIDSDPLLRQLYELPQHDRSNGIFDKMLWGWFDYSRTGSYFGAQSELRLRLVCSALNWYYLEHGETLPETLDALVAGGYLEAVPVCPLNGKAMQYVSAADEKAIAANKDKPFYTWNDKPGWQRIYFPYDCCFGYYYAYSLDLHFLPGYEEYGKRDK